MSLAAVSLQWQGFLFSFGVVIIWGIVFGVSIYFTRKGMRERDSETQQDIREEEQAEAEAGWRPLLS